MKYNERLVEKIARLIEEDTYTIGEICDALKISRNTFYEWKSTKPEFQKAIEDAEDRRDDTIAALARQSLKDQLEGYIETTEKIVYEDDGWGGQKMKSKTVTKKKKAPNARIVKLALERQEKNREKREMKNNASEKHPIVIKFAKDVDQNLALQTMIDFEKKVNEKQTPLRPEEEDDDDSNYITVKI